MLRKECRLCRILCHCLRESKNGAAFSGEVKPRRVERFLIVERVTVGPERVKVGVSIEGTADVGVVVGSVWGQGASLVPGCAPGPVGAITRH